MWPWAMCFLLKEGMYFECGAGSRSSTCPGSISKFTHALVYLLVLFAGFYKGRDLADTAGPLSDIFDSLRRQ